MLEGTQMHPGQLVLLTKCTEIGLNDQETEILLDLFGWKERDEAGYTWHQKCILPQMVITTEYRSAANEVKKSYDQGAKAIGDLILTLLGTELQSDLRVDPLGLLEGDLHLSHREAIWVVSQVELEKQHPELSREVFELMLIAPERMPNIVVLPVLAKLLDRPRK